MHAPGWVCRRLHKLHPQLRLAWAGKPKKNDELNPGAFALIQLYHISDTGNADDPNMYRMLWDVDAVEGKDGAVRTKRVDRGPIFNKNGGCSRDWDPAFRVPVFVATLDEDYGVTEEEVLNGKFLSSIERWMVPIERRMRESARENGRNFARAVDDVAHDASGDLLRDSQKSDAATVIMANKHAKKDIEAMEAKVEARGKLEDAFELPPVK
jgi:molybdopterin converting factor small subunit